MRAALLLTIWATSALGFPASAREFHDSAGHTVHLADHPKRIVTLTPALGEIAASFCRSPGQIVGVSTYTDFPLALAQVKTVASMSRLNLEEVVALKPDLVLADSQANPRDQVDRLRELGIPVVVTDSASLTGIERTVSAAGQAMGEPEEAARLSARIAGQISGFRGRARAREKRGGSRTRVLLQVDQGPLIVAGGKSFIADELAAIGAVNVYGELGQAYPRPAMEDAIRRDPDVIVVLGSTSGSDYAKQEAKAWERFPNLKAVRTHSVKVLDSETVARPGPRVLEGMALLEKVIYGARGGK